MFPRQIDVHPEAVAEAQAAAQWYRERSALAADAFLAELDSAVERIAENPEMYPHYTMFKARGVISCSAFLSIWYIAKLSENLRSLPLHMVGENPDIGRNV